MKHIFSFACLFLIFLPGLFAQAVDSNIYRSHKKYYQFDRELNEFDLGRALAGNHAAALQYHKYRTNKTVALPCIIVGGAAMVAGLGIEIANIVNAFNDMNHDTGDGSDHMEGANLGSNLVEAGTVVALIGAACMVGSHYHLKKARRIYNYSLQPISAHPVRLDFMVKSGGIGIRLNF